MLRRIRSFLRHPASERFLLLKALFVVAAVRVALSLLPFPHFHGLFERVRTAMGVRHDITPAPPKAQLVWAVRAASHYVPRASCLTQAAAAQLLLERYGYPSELHIGVARNGEGGQTFDAHAWLESNGTVVIGESEVSYVSLITI
jgi:hypothetical protein